MPPDQPTKVTASRSSLACMACRAIKVKCIFDKDQQNATCRRCTRLDIPCELLARRRGRKTNAERASMASTLGQTEDQSQAQIFVQSETSDLLQLDPMWTRRSPPGPTTSTVRFQPQNVMDDAPLQHLDPSLTLLDLSMQAGTSFSQQQPRQNPSQPQHEYATNNLLNPSDAAHVNPPTSEGNSTSPLHTAGGTSNRSRRVDVSEMLDPDETDPFSLSASSNLVYDYLRGDSAASLNDPISLGYLSVIEAMNLIQQFFRHLNPIIALLDEKFHTFDYIRSSSSTLFTAVVAVASRFFRPELFHPLLSHTHTLINRDANAGTCNVGTIQALVIVIYWKEPRDRSAWIKIGLAIRMAYQLDWHIHRSTKLPDDPQEARRVLDAERSWFCLVCFDRAYSALFRLPSMIRPRDIGDPLQWAMNHAHLDIPQDTHLACSVEHTGLSLSASLEDAASLSKEGLQVVVDQLSDNHRNLARRWFSPESSIRLPDSTEALLRWLSLNRLFNIKRVAVNNNLGLDGGISEAMSVLTQVVEQVEVVATKGDTLLYMQDILACALSELAVFVRQVFRKLSISQRSLAIRLLRRVHGCCPQQMIGGVMSPTAFVARFTEKTLRRISAESRVGSRVGSPDPMAQQTAEEMAPIQDLDRFLASLMNESNGMTENLDSAYWSSLFLTDSDNVFNEDPGPTLA